jgi:hypothetical protein
MPNSRPSWKDGSSGPYQGSVHLRQGKTVRLWVEALDGYIRQVERELHGDLRAMRSIEIGWQRDAVVFHARADRPDGGTIEHRTVGGRGLPRLETRAQLVAVVEQVVALPCYTTLPRAGEMVFRQDHPGHGLHEVVVQSGRAGIRQRAG